MDGPTPELIHTLLGWLKDGPAGAIPIRQAGEAVGALQAVTWEDAGDVEALERLCGWHAPATAASLRRWLQQGVLPSGDRVLFWVRAANGAFVGHVGLAQFDLVAGTVALGDVAGHGAEGERYLGPAVEALTAWAREQFGLEVRARSVSDGSPPDPSLTLRALTFDL